MDTLADPALLTLQQVGKRYGNGTVALQAMDLRVERQSFVSLLGPSGCGKSTVLKLIAGLLPMTSGHLQWHAPSDVVPDIAFVFQDPTLMPWATVFDNVWLPLRLRGVSREKAQAVVHTGLAAVGLSDVATVYPRELSGGMKMRVSIARAMVTQPQLLLMDEPFAALDELTRTKLNNDTLTLWAAHGFTALFVTHSVYEAVYLSQRIVVMGARPGRVVADIAVDEPYPRTADFRTSARFNAWCVEVSQALAAGES